MQSQSTVVLMRSPEGELKEVTVVDPHKDLVPLMVAGYRQVFVDQHAPAEPAQEK